MCLDDLIGCEEQETFLVSRSNIRLSRKSTSLAPLKSQGCQINESCYILLILWALKVRTTCIKIGCNALVEQSHVGFVGLKSNFPMVPSMTLLSPYFPSSDEVLW